MMFRQLIATATVGLTLLLTASGCQTNISDVPTGGTRTTLTATTTTSTTTSATETTTTTTTTTTGATETTTTVGGTRTTPTDTTTTTHDKPELEGQTEQEDAA